MSRTRRIIASFLALLLLQEALLPTVVLALSSGPSQPEVQGFKPAGTNDMVNLFSGDFSYNIPLLDVEGYPVNLAYSAGVGMDQEASWVGLGWSLSPGVVERNLRGLPDDFAGDQITRNMNLRPNRTFGVSFNAGLQVFGAETSTWTGQLNLGVSPSFNNYDGPQFGASVSLSMKSTSANDNTMTCGLGLNSSSNQGLTVSPRVGFDRAFNDGENRHKAGLNFGLSLNSMQGLTNTSFGATLSSAKQEKMAAKLPEGVSGPPNMVLDKVKTNKNMKSGPGFTSAFDLGSPTYSPQVSLPMTNISLSTNATMGLELWGGHPNATLGGFYSEQHLREKTTTRPAYGYLHLQGGQNNGGAMMDFNREKDGPYSAERVGLGLASLTNDVFSVSGQGIGGSYRPFRSDIGHVFDPSTSSTGAGGSFGVEFGAAAGVHAGGDFMVNLSNTTSGDWTSGNQAGNRLKYRSLSNDPVLEPVFFREANEATVEQDSALWNAFHREQAVQFTLPHSGAKNRALGASFDQGGDVPSVNYRQKREPRGQLFSYLSQAQAEQFGLNVPPNHPTLPGNKAPAHHISEVTVTGKGGGRYVYGYPVYNTIQKDVEFAVAHSNNSSGLVTNYGNANTVGNSNGKDHYFSETITPAYAYAWLLTAVVSPDYSDIDDIRGPSDGDLGTFTKFTYLPNPNTSGLIDFSWRTPISDNSPSVTKVARLNKGREADPTDDKASYVYGTKEVKYLRTIEGRNFIAIFELNVDDNSDKRLDAMGAGEDGVVSNNMRTRYLTEIALYKKVPAWAPEQYETNGAVPIKKVHFEYDYELCPATPNSIAPNNGKLTLKKVWFTYGKSDLGVTTPYSFNYGNNVPYEINSQDRWGNYKPNVTALSNSDFPYAEQGASADVNAAAWNLDKIITPSGAIIDIAYEADDYAFVQNRNAMRMVPLTSFGIVPFGALGHISPPSSPEPNYLGTGFGVQNRLHFNVPDDCSGLQDANAIKAALFGQIHDLYFRSKVNLKDNKFDYVSGYARFEHVEIDLPTMTGWVDLRPEPIDENASQKVNPIFRAGLEYMRLNFPSWLHPNAPDVDDDDSVTVDFLYNIIDAVAGFMTGLDDFFTGPNKTLAKAGSAPNKFCFSADPASTWIRVNEPDHVKKGGGHRVKSLIMRDNWASMNGEATKSFTYGQDFSYGDTGGSYGVAAYEPMSGADENPFRQPLYSDKPTRALTPDDRVYQETPFGESLFPGPTVGYSKVIVTDRLPTGAPAAQGTGRVVHEFYTAYDFPTITSMTSVDRQPENNQANLLSWLGFSKVDHMHTSQGYSVETNDMHGKLKQVSVYPEGSDQAITITRYEYALRSDGSRRLSNAATVINPEGEIGRAEIGRQYEFVADTRQFISEGKSGGMMLNLDVIPLGFIPLPVPVVLPKYSSQSTIFKSGVLVKKIHRFGLLQRVTQVNNGSSVTTENLAYDAQTGNTLLTKLTNAFKDPIYSFNFPAYWHYDGMGPAYKNIGVHLPLILNNSGTATVSNAAELFYPGDELALTSTDASFPKRGWVNEVGPNSIDVIDKQGNSVEGVTCNATVIRSGRRNMQDVDMMTMTLQSNPLIGMGGNVYTKILNAKAQEFKGDWQSDCACLDPIKPKPNDWMLNRMGQWRLWKEDVWLTDRARTVFDNNSNLRYDGTYTSFAPFYQVLNGQWAKYQAGWTTAREVTKYSAHGQELENKDALKLYSSASFGYRGNLVKTVARNARYQETGFDGFEETLPVDCSDRHFRFQVSMSDMVEGDAHTGRFSLRVITGTPVSFQNDTPWECSENPCADLAVSIIGQNDTWLISAEGGVPPYIFATDIQSGTPTFWPIPSGGLGAGNVANSMTVITVTDAYGCTATEFLEP